MAQNVSSLGTHQPPFSCPGFLLVPLLSHSPEHSCYLLTSLMRRFPAQHAFALFVFFLYQAKSKSHYDWRSASQSVPATYSLHLSPWCVVSLPSTPLHFLYFFYTKSSQSRITTGGQSFSMSSCRAPSGTHDKILFAVCQLLSGPCGAPSLTRGRVCRLSVTVSNNKSIYFLTSKTTPCQGHLNSCSCLP
jgi:hypothetical protein